MRQCVITDDVMRYINTHTEENPQTTKTRVYLYAGYKITLNINTQKIKLHQK